MEKTKNVETKIIVPILLFCFSLALITQVRAEYNVGVKKGDWIQYRISASTNVMGQWQTLANNWIKITINNVSGTVVSLTAESDQSGWTPKNFTVDIASDCQLNLVNPITSPISGIGGVQSPLMAFLATNLFIIPANLTASSEIHTGYFSYVNVTDTTQYSGHDTAHYSGYSYSGILVPADVYWDRQKGILLEYNAILGPNPNAQYKSSITVESTNMWSMPIDWLPWAVIAAVVVVVIGVSIFILRKRRYQAKPPTQQTAPTLQPIQT